MPSLGNNSARVKLPVDAMEGRKGRARSIQSKNGKVPSGTPSSDRLTPQSLEAEQATLGAMLMERDAISVARQLLKAPDFYRQNHRLIFEALCGLYDAGQPIDLITVVEALRASGNLEEIGGVAYLTALIQSCPSSANIEAYARPVLDTSRRREVIQLAETLETLAFAPDTEPEALCNALSKAAEIEAQAAKTAKPRFPLRSLAEIISQPKKPALIAGIAPQNCLFALSGPYGSFKSFIALDWALSIASGRPWHGHSVAPGPVIYIAAEGVEGIGKRAQAWSIARRVPLPENVSFVTDAPQLMQPADVEALLREIKKMPEAPRLIVIDTLARHMAGGDENLQRDMNAFVSGADRLWRETGAAVLLIHHSGKNGKMRGSTVLPGGLDALFEVQATGEKTVTLTCDKQKDNARFKSLGLVAHVCELPERDEQGNPLTSLVFDLDTTGPKAAEVSPKAKAALDALASFPEGASYSQWEAKTVENGARKGSFHYLKDNLLKDGHAFQDGQTKLYHLSTLKDLNETLAKAGTVSGETDYLSTLPPSLEGKVTKVKVSPGAEGTKAGRNGKGTKAQNNGALLTYGQD
jgi:hypothetical protein